MNDTASNKSAGKWRIGLFLIMVVVGGLIAWLVNRSIERGKAPDQRKATEGVEVAEAGAEAAVPKLPADEVRRLIGIKDTAIGHLENGPTVVQVGDQKMSGLEVAAQRFAELVTKLPKERLPVLDLAITRLLILRGAEENVSQQRTLAREAAQHLLDFEPDSAVAYWIAANVELVQDSSNPLGSTDEAREKAVALLTRATQLDPGNAVFWFALSRAATKPREMVPNAEALAALGKAHEANPGNVFVLTEWLVRQAQTKDPKIAQTLASAKETFAPLATAINTKPGVDVEKLIAEASEAVAKDDWRTTEMKTRLIQNISRPPDMVQSDIARIDIHPLEFVAYDFSPEFYRVNPRPEPEWTEETPVRLTPASVQPPALAGVTDLRVIDVDLNGRADLVVLQPGKLTLLTQVKPGEPWTELASLEVPAGLERLLAADLDRDSRRALSAPSPDNGADAAKFDHVMSETSICHDADPDFVLYGPAGVLAVRNDTDAAADQPKLVAMPNEGLEKLTGVTAVLLADVDHDADLDLVCSSEQGISIWEATGNWESTVTMAYKEISAWSQLPPANVPVTSMVAVDWDRDVDIDVILAEPTGKVVGVLENMRHAQFRWTPLDAAYEALGAPRSIALLEADGNVSWDLAAAGQQGVQVALTATPRAGTVNYLRTEKVDQAPQDGVLVWDFDNDGYRDLVAWGAAGLSVFRGGPQGRFKAVQIIPPDLAGPIQMVRAADLDRDGDQDLVVVTPDQVLLLMNEGGTNNTWLALYPVGTKDNKGRCNHNAIGSLVELRSGGWYQAQTVDAPVVHFGLGDSKVADQVRIVWTNGVPQDVVDDTTGSVAIAGNVAVCERMILKGSCPYVYTMADGEFIFLTDCLWAAPLGLQSPSGGVEPTRAWEYLRVPGERLTPKDGSYWVLLTQELWEAGYFDYVQLIAVDHPADVEVYTNEKVGPPELVEHKIYTVRERRFPRSVVDSRGNDLQDLLRERDGEFAQPFSRPIRQGLVPEHYMELDLGPLENPQQITLFLTGWILPTDTSLNVAFRQDPETDGPRMPSVWVPDADGQWKETIPFMGFPGGKTKTIAVDLSHAFLTNDYRLRIQTTGEFYWDEVFFTVDEPAVEVRQIPLTLQSADLAYRGFSRELPRKETAPRLYDYADVKRTPNWPPMRGRFTRYGAVHELLSEADDQMAILGSGDAITVRFAVPDEPVPEGWKRDFILHSIGYDKDADLNTIYGQTVEPLPFRAMQSYPYGPEEPAPDSPAYHEYLRRYQTREADPNAFWRYLLLPGA